jgi:hypothetical protein
VTTVPRTYPSTVMPSAEVNHEYAI